MRKVFSWMHPRASSILNLRLNSSNRFSGTLAKDLLAAFFFMTDEKGANQTRGFQPVHNLLQQCCLPGPRVFSLYYFFDSGSSYPSSVSSIWYRDQSRQTTRYLGLFLILMIRLVWCSPSMRQNFLKKIDRS